MSYKVTLHVYDLSQGLAKQWSQALLGTRIEGIWHTGIVVFAKEFFFGGGICVEKPGQTPYGSPLKTVELGYTSKTLADFENFLSSIRHKYSFEKYDLLKNNCNHFTNECSWFLVKRGIPEDILNLPETALDTPLGSMLKPLIENLQQQFRESIGSSSFLTSPGDNFSAATASSPLNTQHTNNGTTNLELLQNHLKEYQSPFLLKNIDEKLVNKKLLELHPNLESISEESLLQLLYDCDSSKVFPILDRLRFSVLTQRELACRIIDSHLCIFLKKYCVVDAPWSAMLMTFRLLTNMFSHSDVINRFLSREYNRQLFIESLNCGFHHSKPSVVETACTALRNFCGWLYFSKINVPEDELFCLIHETGVLFQREDVVSYGESVTIHLLVSIGFLCLYHESLLELAKAIEVYHSPVFNKTNNCKQVAILCKDLYQLLSS
eukprot:jgi/Galph1/137/GphlegSOOS_G4767.1